MSFVITLRLSTLLYFPPQLEVRLLARFHLAPKSFKLRPSVSLEYKLVGGTSLFTCEPPCASQFTILALVTKKRAARDTVSLFSCVRDGAPLRRSQALRKMKAASRR